MSKYRQELTTNSLGHVITLRNQGDFNSLGDANSFPTNLMNYQTTGYHYSQDIITDGNDDLIVTGMVDNTIGTATYNLNVSKYQGITGLASQLWSQSFAATKFEEITDAAVLSNGDIIVTGNSRYGFTLSGTTIAPGGSFVMSLSGVNGVTNWVQPLTNSQVKAVAIGLMDQIFIAGDVLNADGEFYLFQLDASGLLQHSFVSDPNPSGEVRIMDLSVKTNGQIYLSGYISEDVIIANNLMSPMNPPNDKDIVLIRMQNISGSLTYAREDGEIFDTRRELTIQASILYPNPAITTVKFDLAQVSSYVDVEIFDLTGQLVKLEFAVNPSTGIDVSQLKPGVYMIRGKHEKGNFEERFLKR